MSDTNHVLVKSRWNSCPKVYHLPSEDDPSEPACGYSTRNPEWRKKDPEVIPHHRPCKQCTGNSEYKSTEGKRPSTALKETGKYAAACPECGGSLYSGSDKGRKVWRCDSPDCQLSGTPIGRSKQEVRRVNGEYTKVMVA